MTLPPETLSARSVPELLAHYDGLPEKRRADWLLTLTASSTREHLLEALASHHAQAPRDARLIPFLADLFNTAPDLPLLPWLDPALTPVHARHEQLLESYRSDLQTLQDLADPQPSPRVLKPVFIVGCGRSGTAMLCNLLSEHPRLQQTPGYPDGEDHVGWIRHGHCVISGLGATPDIDQGHTGYHYCLHMTEWDVTQAACEAMHRHYHEVLGGDHTRFVINKNAHLSNKLRYVRQIFPDARFIHIVRDCAPMVSSWIKEMAMQRHQLLYWPDTDHPCFSVLPRPSDPVAQRALDRNDRCFPGGGMMRLVDYWNSVNTHIAPQLADAPAQLLTVRYEDVLADPDECLSGIYNFLDLPPQQHQMSVRRDNNEKFRQHLDTKLIHHINEQAHKVREVFGYA